MNRIRVLLANYPMMISDVIKHSMESQEDMELVGDCRGPMRILQETGRVKADAVILAQEGTEEPGLCSQLLAVYPDVILMCVTADMKLAYIRRLCICRKALSLSQEQDLPQALRSAIHDLCTERGN